VPLFVGLDILSHNLFLLSMLQLPLFYYFITGICLGYLYKKYQVRFENIHRMFPKGFYLGSIVLFILVVCLKLFVLNSANNNQDLILLIHIIWAFPMTFIMAIALDPKTALSKLLRWKAFIFLGTISYSMYLLHTPILHIVEETYKFTDVFTNVLSIILILALTIIFSRLLYELLEKPYFSRPKIKSAKVVSHRKLFYKKPVFILPTIMIVYIVSIFAAYQSSFNFFSVVYPYRNVIQSPSLLASQTQVSLESKEPIRMEIQGVQDNLQIISIHLIPFTDKTSVSKQNLVFKIKEKGEKNWYATNSYPIEKLADLPLPFGFPLITNAKGKTYTVELSLSNPQLRETIAIDTTSVQGVYKADKQKLLKNPMEFIAFVNGKILTVVENPMAQKSLLLFIPFAVIIGFLPLIKREKSEIL
jgi:hypothetical protein